MTSLADDRHAAQDVIVSYAACVDERDLDGYAALFEPDAEIVGFASRSFHGIDAWRAFVEKALEPYAATQHMLGVPKIEIEGDRATLRTDVRASHFFREPKGRCLTLWATYRTELVRRGGGWRIRRHELLPRATRIDEPVA